jgi:hypothetical protein
MVKYMKWKNNLNNNEKPLVRFISTVTGLSQIEECAPKPLKSFIPEWWKDIPTTDDNIKKCPSFPDFFSKGYVVPIWTDVKFAYDEDVDLWNSFSSPLLPKWDIHSNQQFVNYKKPSTLGKEGNIIFKAMSPWRLITPPGYSVWQMPLFYHFNENYSVLPGIIDTDIVHETNVQVLYHGKGNEVSINRGDPLVVYVPFKRETFDLSVEELTEETDKYLKKVELDFYGKTFGSGLYRRRQRERDERLAE